MDQLPSNPIRTLVLSDSTEGGDIIANLLRAEPGFAVSVSTVAFGEGLRAARRNEPDVIILVADSLAVADVIIAIEELESAVPSAAIVVLTSADRTSSRDFILAGARDCLVPPYTRDALVTSLRTVHLHESRRRERLAANIQGGLRRHRCHVIAIHGAKGGVGTTTTAVNLAVALRQITQERVAVVDASLQTGDVGVALNLVSSASIDDLLPNLNGLDVDLLNKVLINHPTGVQALLAPRDLERAEAIGGDELRRILAFMASHFDYMVIDTAPTLDAAGLAALDHADQIALLTVPEIPALKNAGRFLQLSRRLGYPSEKIALVVNRANSQQAIPLSEIERSLGVKPIATIPSAGKLFIRAANRGELVAVSAGFRGPSRSFHELAARFVVATDRPRRSGLFSWAPRLGADLFQRRDGATPPTAQSQSAISNTNSVTN